MYTSLLFAVQIREYLRDLNELCRQAILDPTLTQASSSASDAGNIPAGGDPIDADIIPEVISEANRRVVLERQYREAHINKAIEVEIEKEDRVLPQLIQEADEAVQEARDTCADTTPETPRPYPYIISSDPEIVQRACLASFGRSRKVCDILKTADAKSTNKTYAYNKPYCPR